MLFAFSITAARALWSCTINSMAKEIRTFVERLHLLALHKSKNLTSPRSLETLGTKRTTQKTPKD